jgi:hypothetical protein
MRSGRSAGRLPGAGRRPDASRPPGVARRAGGSRRSSPRSAPNRHAYCVVPPHDGWPGRDDATGRRPHSPGPRADLTAPVSSGSLRNCLTTAPFYRTAVEITRVPSRPCAPCVECGRRRAGAGTAGLLRGPGASWARPAPRGTRKSPLCYPPGCCGKRYRRVSRKLYTNERGGPGRRTLPRSTRDIVGRAGTWGDQVL